MGHAPPLSVTLPLLPPGYAQLRQVEILEAWHFAWEMEMSVSDDRKRACQAADSITPREVRETIDHYWKWRETNAHIY